MKRLATAIQEASFEELRDLVARRTGIVVRDRRDRERAYELLDRVRKLTDGHVTLLGFTTNWRCCFATIDVRADYEFGVEWMPHGRTDVEAICCAAACELLGLDLDPNE